MILASSGLPGGPLGGLLGRLGSLFGASWALVGRLGGFTRRHGDDAFWRPPRGASPLGAPRNVSPAR
eukprot:3872439-Pyramimonas_sp.AAC.1